MFKDKVVVVTGAGSGIGRELALQFADAGAQLAISDISQAGLDQTLAMLAAKPRVSAPAVTCWMSVLRRRLRPRGGCQTGFWQRALRDQ